MKLVFLNFFKTVGPVFSQQGTMPAPASAPSGPNARRENPTLPLEQDCRLGSDEGLGNAFVAKGKIPPPPQPKSQKQSRIGEV